METKKISRKSRTVAKNRKGGPFTLIRFCRLRLKSEKPKGALWRQFFEIKSHSAEKKSKGGPFSPVRFCRLLLKSKNQRALWRQKKFFEKKSHSAEKNQKGTL